MPSSLVEHFQLHPDYLSALGVSFDADQVALLRADGGYVAYWDWVPDPSYFPGDPTLSETHWPPFVGGLARGDVHFVSCPGVARLLDPNQERDHPYFGTLRCSWPEWLDHTFGEYWRGLPLLIGVPSNPFETVPHVFLAFFDVIPISELDYQTVIALRDRALEETGFLTARAVFAAIRRGLTNPVAAYRGTPGNWLSVPEWEAAFAEYFPYGEPDLTGLKMPGFRLPSALAVRFNRLARRSQANWRLLLESPDDPLGTAGIWLHEEVNPWF